MAKKKRQHYLARFYLDGFIDPHNEPYIWIYEKGNLGIRKASSKDIAVKRYYYSFPKPNGSKDTESWENAFAKLEEFVAPILKKIMTRTSLDDEDRWLFSLFLAFTIVKVPNFREGVEESHAKFMKQILQRTASQDEGLKTIIDGYEKETGEKLGIPAEELQEWILDDKKYEIKTRPEYSLFMLALGPKLTPIFFQMKWCFLKATSEYKFVTCDNPLFLSDPTHDPRSFDGVGLLAKNIEVIFPISKDWIFFGSWEGKEGYGHINNKLAKEFTRRTVSSAQRFVFASVQSESLNRMVQKYIKSAPRIQMGGVKKIR